MVAKHIVEILTVSVSLKKMLGWLVIDSLSYVTIMLTSSQLGHDVTKPIFGVSDKASFKPVSSATETS